MKYLITLFCLIATTFIYPQQSSYLNKGDLDLPGLPGTGGGFLKVTFPEYIDMQNQATAVSLANDAYFTIGTTAGLSASTLDDQCQISFGHPYALTSFPLIGVDGNRYRLEEYFLTQPQTLYTSGDSLLGIYVADSTTVGVRFELSARDDGATIRLYLEVENFYNGARQIDMGLLFDPALGNWGDGTVFLDGSHLPNDTLFSGITPHNLQVWERPANPRGLGISINVPGNPPDGIHVGNWRNLYGRDENGPAQIYDAGILFDWQPVQLPAGATLEFSLDIRLSTPDFPAGPFLRTDIPEFYSIENNLLFPRSRKALVKTINNGTTTLSNLEIFLEDNGFMEGWESTVDFSIAPGASEFQEIQLTIPENYEDRIITANLNLEQNGQVIDQINRTVFVPAAPFSDSGLVVNIESVAVDHFPEVQFTFNSRIEETGQLLTDLREENIFLFEDGRHISDITLEKDTVGGVNQADIIFVLDVTGSMSNEIADVRDNIIEFADSLTLRGINFRLGMVTFRDAVAEVIDFTTDVQVFRGHVARQTASGGGGRAENSLEALMRATLFSFRPQANRTIIWITDADYHINNRYTQLTIPVVVNALLANSIVTHCIGNLNFQLSYYDPIVLATGGSVYDINGNFRDILITLSRLSSTGLYNIAYHSSGQPGMNHEIRLEVHYAGLGGDTTFTYFAGSFSSLSRPLPKLNCFPNPFNPVSQIQLFNPKKLAGSVFIYNILGQKIKEFPFARGTGNLRFNWYARNNQGNTVSNGIYLVSCRLADKNGRMKSLPIQKLIYVK